MANEDKKDFNAMLHKDTDMPKVQIVTDEKTIQKYGGSRMYFAPPVHYDEVMKRIPEGRLAHSGEMRSYFARSNGADFTPYHSRHLRIHSGLGQPSENKRISRLTGGL